MRKGKLNCRRWNITICFHTLSCTGSDSLQTSPESEGRAHCWRRKQSRWWRAVEIFSKSFIWMNSIFFVGPPPLLKVRNLVVIKESWCLHCFPNLELETWGIYPSFPLTFIIGLGFLVSETIQHLANGWQGLHRWSEKSTEMKRKHLENPYSSFMYNFHSFMG